MVSRYFGTKSKDTVRASGDDDLIDSGHGDDLIVANTSQASGNDTLRGGDGNDTIFGGDGGNTVIDGGRGRDQIFLGRSNNSVLGGEGDDTIQSISGQDTINGGLGDDLIAVQSGFTRSVSVVGGEGDDTVILQAPNFNPLNATTNLTVSLGVGRDSIVLNGYQVVNGLPIDSVIVTDFLGGAAGDILVLDDLMAYARGYVSGENPFAKGFVRVVQSGADTLVQFDADGTAATEVALTTVAVLRGVTASTLVADNFLLKTLGFHVSPNGAAIAANQSRPGSNGADSLVGGVNNDEIIGAAGNDTLRGGAGNDRITGDEGNDSLQGETGDDLVYGGLGNDILIGGQGRDTLEGGGGSDTLSGGDGDDLLLDFSSTVTENVVLNGDAGDDEILFGLGAAGRKITVSGGDGDDTLRYGNVSAAGGTAVQISMGAGIDTLQLNAAGLSNSNPDTVTVTDFVTGPSGDVLDLSTVMAQLQGVVADPFAEGFLRLLQSGTSTLLQVDMDGANQAGASFTTLVTFLNTTATAFTTENFINPSVRPDNGIDALNGSEIADQIQGQASRELISGFAGNDVLNAGAGNDTVLGGAGNDLLDGGDGSDLVEGGTGRDTLVAGLGADTLRGGDGDDLFLSNFAFYEGGLTIQGEGGDDQIVVFSTTQSRDYLIDAGSGDDLIDIVTDGSFLPSNTRVNLTLGSGIDTARLNHYSPLAGSQQAVVTIQDFVAGAGGDVIDLSSIAFNSNSRQFVDPFSTGRARLVQSGTDTLIQADSDGVLGTETSFATVAVLKNVQASQLTRDNFMVSNFIFNSSSLGNVNPSATPNTLRSGDTNDVVYSGLSSDVVEGGAGDDVLYGELGNDTLRGGTGKDNLFGGTGDDSLVGDAGRDTLQGESGNDTLMGGDGDDTLVDRSGNGVLDGGTGDDMIDVLADTTRSVTVQGGTGNDTIQVGSLGIGPDASMSAIITTGSGIDVIRPEIFNLAVLGGQADNLMVTDFVAGPGGDVIDLGFLISTLSSFRGVNASSPFASGFVRLAQSGADTLLQLDVDGNEGPASAVTFMTLKNVTASNLVRENFINPAVAPNVLTETFNGTASNDQLVAGVGNDSVLGGAGDDRIQGQQGNDSLFGGRGQDTLAGGEGNDFLSGEAGSDLLVADSGDDTLLGGDGDDLLYEEFGSQGNDSLDGGAGDDQIFFQTGSARNLTIVDGAGNDLIVEDRIYSIPGLGVQPTVVNINLVSGQDTVAIRGQGALFGLADTISVTGFGVGSTGDSISLDRILTDMQFTGGYSPNSNPFATGFLRLVQQGADTVLQADFDAGGAGFAFQNVLTLKGITLGSLVTENFSYLGSNIDPRGTNPASINNTNATGTVNGAGGNDMLAAGAATAVSLSGASGSDTLQGGAGNDTLRGGAGNDRIVDGAGNDLISGDRGDDVIGTGIGNDSVDGGTGNDMISGTAESFNVGSNTLSGGEGSDQIFLSFVEDGTTNILRGDAGNDKIVLSAFGGSQASTSRFTIDGGAGDDAIEINGTNNLASTVDITMGAGIDVLRINGAKYASNPANLVDVLRVSDFATGASGDVIDVRSLVQLPVEVAGNPFKTGYLRLQQSNTNTLLQIDADGAAGTQFGFVTVATLTGVTASNITADNLSGFKPDGTGQVLAGSALNDLLGASAADDTLSGGAGNDTLFGAEGNNLLNGGNGNDTLNDFLGGNNTLNGDAGNDLLQAGNGRNTLNGGDGDDVLVDFGGRLAGNLVLNGGNGDDNITFSGGSARSVVVDAGEGDDLIKFNGGSEITNPSVVNVTLGAGSDLLQFVASRDQVIINDFAVGSGGDVVDTDTLFVFSQSPNYSGLNPFASGHLQLVQSGVDTHLRFDSDGAAGTVAPVDTAMVFKNTTVGSFTAFNFRGFNPTGGINTSSGSAGSDYMTGGRNNDSLLGGLGNDTLLGDRGDDTLSGGFGDDMLDGGEGNSMLLGGAGRDQLFVGDGSHTLDGGDGDDTLQHFGSTRGQQVTMIGGAGDDQIRTIGRYDQFVNMVGGEGDDVLEVSPLFPTRNGYSTITMTLGSGVDTVKVSSFSAREGQNQDIVTVTDFQTGSGGDVVDLDNILFYAEGYRGENPFNTGFLRLAANGDSTLLQFDLDGAAGKLFDFVNLIQFQGVRPGTFNRENFNTAAASPGTALLLEGTPGNDTLQGGAFDDTISGFGGDDALLGEAGNDILNGGDGNDTLNGSDGNDTLDGGVGTDSMTGGAGNDEYRVDQTTDSVVELADGGIDTVFSSATYTLGDHIENLVQTGEGRVNATGNALDNNLSGNQNNNLLNGAVGNDQLIGGGGNDTLNGGSGSDTLTGGTGDDTYVVDQAGDVIGELGDQGTDSVQSSITYALSQNLENLTLVGTTTINGTGNDAGNILTGNTANNRLNGGAGDDTLNGGGGADTLIGSTGNDVYLLNSSTLTLMEVQNEGTDRVESSLTYTLLDHFENLTLTGTGNINGTGNAVANLLSGNAGINSLVGGAGNDTLNGGLGLDTLRGGTGDDSYQIERVDESLVEGLNEGVDHVFIGAAGYTLGDNFENLTLTGVSGIFGVGNALNNMITGNEGDNLLQGLNGNDTLVGGLGADTLEGGAGNDVLDGGAQADAMTGGLGDDTYMVENASDTVVEAANEGVDSVNSFVSYTLGANLENLALLGEAALSGTGNELSNRITGNIANNVLSGANGNDTLDGGLGADSMSGGLGNDTFVVNVAADVVTESANQGTDLVNSSVTYTLGDHVENLTLTGSSAISGTGNALNNVITGNSGANTLTGGAGNDSINGGAGTDKMSGGTGDDTYQADNTRDVVTEQANEGIDIVLSTATFTLLDHVEHLTLQGSSNINGFGNALDNIIIGNAGLNSIVGAAGNDTLNGGAGNDTLVGGAGDDLFIVDSTNEVVTELQSEGVDLVQSSVTFTLSAHVENLTLLGIGAINGTGNSLNNLLQGNSADNSLSGSDGNDTLDGNAGSDTLAGGAGDDVFVVDTAGDVVIETENSGIDLVNSQVSHVLGAHVENLTLSGTENIAGTGNTLANTIRGNSGDNTLDGAMGADTLIGGQGNDLYLVDDTADVIAELAQEGVDTVQSSATFVLSSHLENLMLVGTAAINGIGNELSNILVGNSGGNSLVGGLGDDTLDGGLGIDTLVGGVGADTYLVDNTMDSIVENPEEGIDIVNSSVSYTLSANLEELHLTGTAAINGTGNALSNFIRGNSSANNLAGSSGNDTLLGMEGNDNLNGGSGSDSMVGGAGNDSYSVDIASDVVVELQGEGTDTVTSSITYMLGVNLENLTLSGSAALNGTGNELANLMRGNSGNNSLSGGAGHDTLDGGAGLDTLVGGVGNDVYVIDSTTDVIIEEASGGTDTVQTSTQYILGANIENLTISGSASIGGSGNSLANLLIGNQGNNLLFGDVGNDTVRAGLGNDTLDGGLGNDSLVGGLGDDIYIVDSVRDLTVELAGQGVDTVVSTLSWTLAREVDNLELQGNQSLSGYGNSMANRIQGNEGDNYLDGLSGNDSLIGGAGDDYLVGGEGKDSLIGGEGADVFAFLGIRDSSSLASSDVITDFVAGKDLIDLSQIDANTATTDVDSFRFIGSGSFSASNATGQLRFENGVLYGSVNADQAAEIVITLTGVQTLNESSLLL